MSILSWAFLGLSTANQLRPIPIQAMVSLLNLCVGTLILRRRQVETNGSVYACVASFPALFLGGWALSMIPLSWPVLAQGLFLGGGGLAVVSFVYLGRSFAILPAYRGTVTRGPYRLVRHPAYLGELLMISGCCLAAPGWTSCWPLLISLPLVALRITAEERVLTANAAYRDYSQEVRWRLVPRVW
jgi:protein-S-isoprenylcysteine O-methyltransferase Ste14